MKLFTDRVVLACVLVVHAVGGPTFMRAASENAPWDSRFFLSDIQGEVRAIAISGQNIYAGGNFTSADSLPVTNIAKWTGTAWVGLGGGVNGTVNTIAIHGEHVFVGGTFTSAGGIPANRIAKWDGAQWSALGSGIATGSVNALAVDGAGKLFLGGNFTAVGGVSARNIAKWDGSSWYALGEGVTDIDVSYVSALVIKGSELFVGGFFLYAGGRLASSIASWNGTTWSAVGGGVDDSDYPPQVAALALMGNDLYVGGAFSSAGSVRVNNVAKWNGTTWTALDTGIGRYFGEIPVTALAASGTRLIAGGRFVSAGGAPANNLAIWDGVTWSELVGGATGRIRAIAALPTNVFVGGSFTPANELSARAIAKWDAAGTGRWEGVSSGGGLGISGEKVAAIARVGTNTYVAGTFDACGTVAASNVGLWNGLNWSALGSGVNGSVLALCAGDDHLFVGGRFSAAGGISASNIAMWNPAGAGQWVSFGSGISGAVEALAWSGSELIAGGSFGSAGGVVASNVARWDGNRWLALGSGLNGPVYALAVQGSNVFVGGKFTSAGGLSASNIAHWNGSQWFSVGGGVGGIVNPLVRVRPPPVSALAVRGNELYVGGDFAWAGGVPATNVARWDGTRWTALDAGLIGSFGFAPPPTVSAMAIDSAGDVYVGGSFNASGNRTLQNICRWTGNLWEPLADGITHGSIASVNAMHVSPRGELIVGGRFAFAGGKPAANFSIWASPVFLNITRSAEGVEIWWAAAAGSYVLEATPSLEQAFWDVVTTTPVARGTNLIVLETGTPSQKFYRLRKD